MIDITFVPGITPITATWLNEANDTLVGLGTSAGASTIGCVPVGIVSATNMQTALAQLAAGSYTDAQTRATLLTGLVTGSNSTILATDTVLTGFGKTKFAIEALYNSVVSYDTNRISFKSTAGTNYSYLAHTNTASRTYTYPDKDGIVAMTSDMSMTLLATATVSTAVASIDFLNVFSSQYNDYRIQIENLAGSITTSLTFRFAVAGAASTTGVYSGALTTTPTAAGSSLFIISPGIQSAPTGQGANGELVVRNANSTTTFKTLQTSIEAAETTTPTFSSKLGVQIFNSTSVVTGLQLLMSSGTINRATVRVYGIRNT